jgi:uncharacterized protein YggE
MTLLAGAMVLAWPASAQVALELKPGETLLEVQAVGQASVAPDVAYLNIGVVSTGLTAKEATDANAAQMTRVIAAIRAAGIEPRHIRSQQINVQPRFARAGQNDYLGQAQISGYVANNNVAVTVTKLDQASAVVSAAFGAGANSVNGPNLGLIDNGKAVAEARKDALATARAEAESYASGLGMRIARVLRVSERGRAADNGADNGIRYRVEPGPVMGGTLETPISPGEVRQRVMLWIDYALAPQ